MTCWIRAGNGRLEAASWGDGAGLPVLLLHEGLGSIRLWKHFPARLAEASGRRVVAWSRAGHGWSAARPEPRGLDYMHREADLLPAVHEALGLERAHWLGHSDGGSISFIAAGRFPALPASLILEAPHVFLEDMTVAGISAVQAGFAASNMAKRMERYHQEPAALFEDWSRVWLSPDFRDWNIEASLDLVTAPALLIQGRDDQFGSMKQLDRAAAALRETTRLELENCAHSPHFDREEAVLAAICEFLKDKD
ncbi:alpha/beta hydrolase [Novosphingobium endophyticum]|uniref:Alpha/beta hydrolase n=1 Tax=Novosphingobium endophyticum TaxID=1955250 RepID=A0A916TTD3_9SPHN|nr:alpha/beta hydrolase [Novosphingobium endophyticum]GGB94821.1 alpha/beta hydrolase [Novosphingobium endophyticum]